VRHVFGYPGGPLAPVYDALYRLPAVHHVLARDEQGAAFMADGYTRASGRPGVCLAVGGPGVWNAATPLACAFSDSTPVLLVAGQVPSRDPRSGYYHENDQLTSLTTFTKSRERVEDPGAVGSAVDRAWAALTTGRPGPVYLEAPGEVLRSPPRLRSPRKSPPWPS
jgi:acetolactate synthase-1/2/3 large subunit